MQQYFISNANFYQNHAIIKGQDLHHLKTVMRMHIGDKIIAVNEDSLAFIGEITSISDKEANINFIEVIRESHKSSKITIAQALIKRERFEWFLEKATELGVWNILPVSFERSIVKIDADAEAKKMSRYQMIVKEAAEQSHRLHQPTVLPVVRLRDIDLKAYDKIIVCYEGADETSNLMNFVPILEYKMKILVVIGPEGGISPQEIEWLKNNNGLVCSLGKRILRSETASLLLLSFFNTLWEC